MRDSRLAKAWLARELSGGNDVTPERSKQISRIYEVARLRAASDRVAFLTEACAGDASLQREVQALLDQPTLPAGLSSNRIVPSRFHAPLNAPPDARTRTTPLSMSTRLS